MKKILLLLLIFVSGCTGVVAQQFDYGKIAPHPRLLLPEGGEEAIKKAIAEYPPLAAFKNVYILTKSFYEADMKKEHEQLDYMKGLTEKREEAAGEHETGKTGTKGIDD